MKQCFPETIGGPSCLNDMTNHNRAVNFKKTHFTIHRIPGHITVALPSELLAPWEIVFLRITRQADSTHLSNNTRTHGFLLTSRPQPSYQMISLGQWSTELWPSYTAVMQWGPTWVSGVFRAKSETHLLLMVSITPSRMMMNMSRPAITPAIFTVLSTCFSGSMVLEFWVEAPWGEKRRKMLQRLTHVTWL